MLEVGVRTVKLAGVAAAGLLDGYKAATLWALYAQLEATGNVQGVHERVVLDRNRCTGGGVTAGIDFGLTLLAELRGEPVAMMTQFLMEYDPKTSIPYPFTLLSRT